MSYLQEDCGIARDSELSANVGEARAINSTDAEVPLAREWLVDELENRLQLLAMPAPRSVELGGKIGAGMEVLDR